MACNEDTPEANAFRSQFAALVSGIQNPQSLADHLFAKRTIAVQVMQEIGKETLTTEEKTRKLLERVYTSITSIDPKHFRVFVEILQQEAYAEQLVKNLELEYANSVLEEESSPPRKVLRMSSGTLGTVAGPETSSMIVQESPSPRKKQNLEVQVTENPFNLFGQKVKSIYLKQPDIPQDDWPPVRKSQYINLALLKSAAMKDDQYSRFTVRGSVDDILKDKDELLFDDVFVDADMGHRILFEGRPGSGKTTLMHRISKKWAKGQILKQITVFILIQLRAFISKINVGLRDVVGFYQPPGLDKLCSAIEQNDGQGFCIAFDGLDEYSTETQKTSFIYKLMMGMILPKSIVIVASRPAASQKFRRAVDRNVEVLGFLKPQIDKYITDYYRNSRAKAEGLIAYLEEHPNVKHACYLPLHLAMVAYLFDHIGFSLPERETEIYRHFTLSTLVRTIEREQGVMDSEISDFEDLPPEKYEMFMDVCELAFKATLRQKLVYSLKEAKEHFNVDPQGQYLGLITVDRQYVLYGREETYSFLHLTLQEFLAAYHLMHLQEDEVMSFIEQYAKKAHMFVVFKFYFGLTHVAKPATESVFNRFLDANKSNQLLLVQCAFESQNTETCKMLAAKGSGIIDLQKKTLNPSDCTALGYVTKSASSAIHETHLVSCSISSEGLNALVKSTADCSFPGEVLNLHGTRLKIDVAPAAAEFLKKASSVTDLRLSKCGIQFRTLSLIAPVLSRMTSLVSLRLEHNDLGNVKSVPILLDIVRMLTNLEEFSTDLQFLASLDSFFSKSQSLKKMSLYDKIEVMSVSRCYTSERNSEYLLDGEQVNVHILGKVLKVCPNLRVLSLHLCDIRQEDAKALATSLRSCPNLQVLNLDHNSIGSDGVRGLCGALKECTTLQKLWKRSQSKRKAAKSLYNNNITDEAVGSLVELLETLKDLKKLNLEHNKFTESGKTTLRQAAEARKELSNFSTCKVSLYLW